MLGLGVGLGVALALACGLAGWAQSTEIDALALPAPTFSAQDYVFRPLVDTARQAEPGFHNATDSDVQARPGSPPMGSKVLQGDAHQQGSRAGTIPVNQGAPRTLTGQVQTLQQAIESESGQVDWYAWYLSARDYLGRTGGLQCALGTPIKFYRNGQIEALSFNPLCQASLAGRRFPLPPKTKLEALILPVRSGEGPPASPAEIYTRIQSGNYR